MEEPKIIKLSARSVVTAQDLFASALREQQEEQEEKEETQ